MPIPGGPLTNIANFRNVIRDISRPYLFMIRIPYLGDDYTVTAFARTASLPEYTLERVEIPFQSQKLRLAGAASFEGTWTVSLLADEAHLMRKRMLQWQQIAYDPTKMLHGHPFEYKADNIQVHQLNRTGETISFYNFIGMYPQKVGNIELSHDSSTEPEKFDVEFAYDYYVIDTNNPFGSTFIGGMNTTVGANVTVGGGAGGLSVGAGIGI
jgi:hypothetical protein